MQQPNSCASEVLTTNTTLYRLPSGNYINLDDIAYIEQRPIKGLSGQLPILVVTSGGAGLKLGGKDALALLAHLACEGRLKDLAGA